MAACASDAGKTPEGSRRCATGDPVVIGKILTHFDKKAYWQELPCG